MATRVQNNTVYSILIIIGLAHLLNDTLQAVIPAMFPILEQSLGLTFTQLGMIAFTLNIVASIMQPIVGMISDKRPMPYMLPLGLTSSMIGIFMLALAPGFWTILISVIFIGFGSAVFHPEGSRVAYLAAGTRRGLAQSIYQVGGNAGQSLAPLITALVLVPLGQFGAIWFTAIAGIAVICLLFIARWYSSQITNYKMVNNQEKEEKQDPTIKKAVRSALVILLVLVFARSWYQNAIANFYTFYAIDSYQFSIAKSQMYIFVFLLLGAVGTFIGGPLADRFGRKTMIVFSLLAPAPFTLLLPYVGPILAFIFLGIIGILLLSSFSVAVVYAQELVPGKIGTMSGLIVGLAFGMGAVGSVALGYLIDIIGLKTTMIIVSALPLLGFLTFLLPNDDEIKSWYA